jgi:hypothetical protein
MDVPASVARLGFRKWYERELIKCHAALVTCFLCGLLVASLLEAVDLVELGWKPVSMLLVVFGAATLGWFSWRTYITMLNRAELYGARSNCPSCRAYGRFKVLDSGMDTHPSDAALAVAPLPYAWMKVECRKCGTGWRMPE